MKMITGSFWGILLILIGLSLVVKTIFHLDFPIFRVVFAILIIYAGISIFLGRSFRISSDDKTQVIFSERKIDSIMNNEEYDVLFGSARFDLQNISIPENETIHLKLNTVFGGTEIIIPDSLSVSVTSNTVFAGTKMPNGNTTAFGTLNFENDSSKNHKPRLIIETNTVFGGTMIRNRPSSDWK